MLYMYISASLVCSFYLQGNLKSLTAGFFLYHGDVCPTLDPASLMIDFEKGSIIAFRMFQVVLRFCY